MAVGLEGELVMMVMRALSGVSAGIMAGLTVAVTVVLCPGLILVEPVVTVTAASGV